MARATIPENATVLSPAQRDDLADRLFIVRCAAEDLATALEEQADRAELQQLVNSLLQAAYAAEALR